MLYCDIYENVIHTEYRFPEDYYRKTLGKYAYHYSDDSLFAFDHFVDPRRCLPSWVLRDV